MLPGVDIDFQRVDSLDSFLSGVVVVPKALFDSVFL
jgi:hypothetical protein